MSDLGGREGEVGWFNWAYFGRGLYSFISVFGGTRCRMEERVVGECCTRAGKVRVETSAVYWV